MNWHITDSDRAEPGGLALPHPNEAYHTALKPFQLVTSKVAGFRNEVSDIVTKEQQSRMRMTVPQSCP